MHPVGFYTTALAEDPFAEQKSTQEPKEVCIYACVMYVNVCVNVSACVYVCACVCVHFCVHVCVCVLMRHILTCKESFAYRHAGYLGV